ncbi:hypothetical protein SCHPADRAFT_1002334 [Schizopora paradoxa]|uniref:F-box domain-containing protein n=1 Tax=Schizopora paradoxa TaxID=27342 RepID=A0A0H2RNU1_9AGAM|nr:hypothetical protein SCHPADRAFT_1002334 [Schizopora paradoxa]
MELRKRLKRMHADAFEGAEASNASTPSEVVVARRKSVKRRRKAPTSGKGSLLLEMPTEIIMEIACYAFPEDLLNLARTSEGLRGLLMSKSSQHAWKSALAIYNFPNCPPDLNEPQFIELLLGKGCSFCPETRARKILTELRVRACKECSKEHIVTIDEVIRKRRKKLPDNVDMYTMVPNFRSGVGIATSKTVGADLKRVLDEVDALRSRPKKLKEYVKEREQFTEACYASSRIITPWLRDASRQKDRSDAQLMTERRTKITERLQALGYKNEDLNTRFDSYGEHWTQKWRDLLDQTRPLTERVWQNIKPQLEEIIRLRRQHAGHRFQAERRAIRQREMIGCFTKFRPQLRKIPYRKLFRQSDFSALTVVKGLIEEDGCRIQITRERWNLVANALFEEVPKLLKVMETDCLEIIGKAVEEASKSIGARLYLWGNDDAEKEEDIVPSPLLSAASLFHRSHGLGSSILYSYSKILRERAGVLPEFEIYCTAWSEELFTSEGQVVTTAYQLLKHLQLPPNTTMAYMLSCGSTFKCQQCPYGRGALYMSWPELVQHFIEENELFQKLTNANVKRKALIPLRNDHDLALIAPEPLVTRVPTVTVELLPTSETGNRYSELSNSWGKKVVYGACIQEDSDDFFSAKKQECNLCRKLDSSVERVPVQYMPLHMRAKHGTDLKGNLLTEGDEMED